MENILKILQEVRPDIDFNSEKNLINDGLLDSFDIVSIISDLNDHFNIAIRVTELDPENFNSIDAIYNMCKKLQESK